MPIQKEIDSIKEYTIKKYNEYLDRININNETLQDNMTINIKSLKSQVNFIQSVYYLI